MIKSAFMAVAAAGLVLSSSAMAANSSPASALSLRSTQAVQPVRASAPTENESQLEGGSGILIALLAAAAVIAGIIIVSSDGNETDVST
jgi:hypothetical protein